MERLRAALFVDFDDVFATLVGRDRRFAVVALRPGQLLALLTGSASSPSGGRRDVLVRRVYLGARVGGGDATTDGSAPVVRERLRSAWTDAGFEVVDDATAGGGTGVRLAVDVMTLLGHATRFDEVLIAAADAVYLPVLQAVRSHDRRTTILVPGPVAPRYAAAADHRLDLAALLAPSLDDGDERPEVAGGSHLRVVPSAGVAPERQEGPWGRWPPDGAGMSPSIEQLCIATGMPALPSRLWPGVFSFLAAGAHRARELDDLARWVQDWLVDNGVPVDLNALHFVTRAAFPDGLRRSSSPAEPEAAQLVNEFRHHVAAVAAVQGVRLSERDAHAFQAWLAGTA